MVEGWREGQAGVMMCGGKGGVAAPGRLFGHKEEFGFYWKVGIFLVQDICCIYAPAKGPMCEDNSCLSFRMGYRHLTWGKHP